MDKPRILTVGNPRRQCYNGFESEGSERMQQKLFSAKLEELNRALSEIEKRAALAQCCDHDALREEIGRLREQCLRCDAQIQSWAQSSRLKCMQDLSQAELDFCALSERISQSCAESENVEMSMLLAEFAIDVAVQAARRAQLAMLVALEQSNSEEEEIS